MPLVMSQEGGQRLLQWLLSIAAPVVPTCHLLGHPFAPSINSTLSQYAAAELPQSGGYAPIALTSPRANWALSGLPQGDQAQYLPISWTFTVAATVYGYYVSDDTFGVSLWGEVFTSPFVYTSSGGVFALNPLLQLTIAGPGPYTMLPSGALLPFAGGTIPAGFLGCDGSAVSQVTYPSLYQAIGTTWNTFRGQSAPAAGTFRVPLLNGLTLVGAGAVGSNPTTTAWALGQVFGEENHTLTIGETANHGHNATDLGHQHASPTSQNFVVTDQNQGTQSGTGEVTVFDAGNQLTQTGFAVVSISTTGGGVAHNNKQPSAAVNYIIAI